MPTSSAHSLSHEDELWMREAVQLAQQAKGLTSPNPCVGAVLVRKGRKIGEGFHQKAGTAHAEVLAVQSARNAGHQVSGSTLYVTLEPCCTHGRTPPCTDLIIREKIKRVVIGALDPNPSHAGRGPRRLRQHGIEVRVGVLKEEVTFLNRDFNRWIVEKRPWVTLKIAMSYDGKITRPRGEGAQLTSKKAQREAHQLRRESDAILIGAETLRKDNPQLTIRHGFQKNKKQPWRVVLTRGGKIPRQANLFQDRYRDLTVVYESQSLKSVLSDLGKKGVMNLLVEGGGRIHASFIREGLVDEVVIFYAPLLTGTSVEGFAFGAEGKKSILKSVSLQPYEMKSLGKDFMVRAIVE